MPTCICIIELYVCLWTKGLISNSGTCTELRTTSFIESTKFACSDSVSHNRVQVLSIPVLLLVCSQDLTCNLQMIVSFEAKGTNAYNRYAMCPAVVRSSVKVSEFDKHLKNVGGHIGRNVVELTLKMKIIVRKPLMIRIIKLRLRNLDNSVYIHGVSIHKGHMWLLITLLIIIWRCINIYLRTRVYFMCMWRRVSLALDPPQNKSKSRLIFRAYGIGKLCGG